MQRRNTIQKNMVFDAVSQLKNHATADEIFEYLKQAASAISRGTVYRNLNILAQEGKIRKIEVPGEADCYDHNLIPHHHVRCIKCGRVFDVDMAEMPDMLNLVNDSRGFVFLGCDIVFKGICSDCNLKEEKEE